MATLTITSKGQVTLRKEVLRHLGVGPGQKIELDKLPNGRFELSAAKVAGKGKIADAFGILERPGQKAKTLGEIKDAIEEGWAGIR